MSEQRRGFDFPKWLRWFLLAAGAMLCCATFAIFFPADLMADFHRRLGLGTFPDQPITLYLARSTSLMYAVHGVMMLAIAWQIERYWGLVPLLGILHVAIGLLMLGIDLAAGMPWYWTAVEGGPIAAAGGLMLWMWKQGGGWQGPLPPPAR